MTQILETTTWNSLSARLGRNDLPYTLAKAVLIDETLTDPTEIAKGITDAWTMAEWPERQLEVSIWEMLFDRTGYIEDGEMKEIETIPADLVLYRGAIPDRKGGMSWTDDIEKAKWFARRFNISRDATVGAVYRMEIPNSFVLGHFTGRGENEWVVATAELDEEEFQFYAEAE